MDISIIQLALMIAKQRVENIKESEPEFSRCLYDNDLEIIENALKELKKAWASRERNQ